MTRTRILLALWLAAFLHPAHAQIGECTVHAGAGTGKALVTVPANGNSIEACAKAIPKPGQYTLKVKATKPAEPPIVTPPAVTWVLVGPEKNAYTLPGRYRVRFGDGSKAWVVRVIEGAFVCNTNTFGDPSPGAQKRCERESVTTTDALSGTEAPPVDPGASQPPPVVTPPPAVVGGVPKREDFDGYPTSGPIVARAGQVIEKLRISSASGPCVRVSVPNVTIRDVLIGPCGSDVEGKGIDAQAGTSNITMQRIYFEDVSTGVTAHQATHPLLLTHSYIAKIRGPMPKGQLIQFDKVQGSATSRVLCNVADSKGQPSKWRKSEDWVNVYATSNVEVAYNRFRGGSDTSTSGTAILFGDSDGGVNLWAHHNTIVDVSNVGIGIAGGDGGRADANRIYMDGPTSGNYTNVGIYASRQGTRSCANARITNNRIWVRKNGGGANPRWIDLASCPGSTESGNTLQDASLTAAIFDEVPAECR